MALLGADWTTTCRSADPEDPEVSEQSDSPEPGAPDRPLQEYFPSVELTDRGGEALFPRPESLFEEGAGSCLCGGFGGGKDDCVARKQLCVTSRGSK